MERAFKAVLLLAGMLVGLGVGAVASAQTCAFTQDPNICVQVTGPASVTKSTVTAPTYWAINVSIYNGASNVLNRVKFTGHLAFISGGSPEVVYFVNPHTGQAPPAGTTYPYAYLTTTNPSISCSLTDENSLSCGSDGTASIQPGQTLSFTVMSNVPTTTGQNKLTWDAKFAEGNSTSGNSNEGTAAGTLSTQVAEPSPDSAAASFPASGGTLSTAPDAFTTKIVIPSTATSTNASITETPNSDPRCKNFRTCYTSDVSIPGFTKITAGAPLAIDLFMAESNIKKGVKIQNILIYYTYIDGFGNVVEVKVDPCPVPGEPLGGGIPCLDKSVHYRNTKSSPSWTTPIGFGFYWQLINDKNGRLSLL